MLMHYAVMLLCYARYSFGNKNTDGISKKLNVWMRARESDVALNGYLYMPRQIRQDKKVGVVVTP
jgi:hypothetical protein